MICSGAMLIARPCSVELLRPAARMHSALLFLGTYRSEDRATSPFLQVLFEAQALAR